MKGKIVYIDTKSNLEAKLKEGTIPSSAMVFIKDVGQIYFNGTYFGAYSVLSKTSDGLAPKGGDKANSQISNVDTEWVLTVTSGANPSWRKLPANAFSNTDTNVLQKLTTTGNYRPIVLGYNGPSEATQEGLTTTITNHVYTPYTMYAQPSTGTLYINNLKINNTSAAQHISFSRGSATDYPYNYICAPAGGIITISPNNAGVSSTSGMQFDSTGIHPAANAAYSLGTESQTWNHLYVRAIHVPGTNKSTAVISADSGDNLYFKLGPSTNSKTPLVLDLGELAVRPGTSYTNTFDLGTSSVKWKNVYATTFNGDLTGNATSATKINIQAIGTLDMDTMYGDDYRGTVWYGEGGNSAVNNPIGDTNAFGMQIWRNAYGYTAQLIMDSSAKLHVRQYTGSAWSALKTFAFITDITKSQVGLGNVQNTAFYLRKTNVNGEGWNMAGTTNGDAFTIFAPTTAGTKNQVLLSNGSGAPVWANQSSLNVGKLNGCTDETFYKKGYTNTYSTSKSIDDINNTAESELAWNVETNTNLKLANINNALAIIIGGESNQRKAMIQVGHSDAKYANYLGELHLNPLGGNVFVNGVQLYASRTFTIGDTAKSLDDSADIIWTPSEIGYKHEWTTKIQCATWSRLCYVKCAQTNLGSSYIINIKGTRNSVIYNYTYLVTVHHGTYRSNIVQLGGSNYSAISVRACTNENGSAYLELYETARNATNSTIQDVRCNLIPISCGEITKYTTFTDGTTIPSGFSVGTQLDSKAYENSIQATNFVGNLVGNVENSSVSLNGQTLTVKINGVSKSLTNTDTWTAWKGATSSAAGTAGYMPAPTSAQRNQFLRGDGTWVSLNNYALPTASSTVLGGVKTGDAITTTTGYTAVNIKDGVLYFKNTDLSNYVTLNSEQTITGIKTFSNSIKTNVIDNTSDSNKITLVPHFSYGDLGIEVSSTAEVYLKAWLKKVCELYHGSKGIFRGTISPDSTRMIEVYIYSTSRKDSETGLPEHSFGVCYSYSRTHHYTFGTQAYVFGCNIMLTDSNYTSYTYSKSSIDSKIDAIANLKNTTITTYAGLMFSGIKGYVNTNTAIASNDFVATNSSAAIGWGKDNSKVLLASQASKNDGTIFIRQYYTSWGAWNKLLHSGNFTDYIYSKSQTDDAISKAIADLVGSAPETLNTLEEISKYLEDGTVAGGLLEQLSNKVDKTDTTYLKTYTRKDIGTSPNFDDPGINGVFEVRNSSETTGESGTKPFNAFGPMLSVKAENVILQIASQSQQSLKFRSKQSANVTLKDIPWRTLLDSVNYTDYVYSKSQSTANFYGATKSRTANTVLAAPNGKDGVATFRKLVETDIPNLNWTKITNTPTTLNGYGITDALQTKQLFTKKDYEHWVVLLCKIGTNTSLTCHRLSGKIHTYTHGSTRYQAADVDLYKSDWAAGNDGYLRFTPYGLGTNWKLVTCTYDGSTWLGLSNTNTQQTIAIFDGTSYNIDFTAIHYYTSNTQTIVNSEINSSIKEVTDYITVLSSDNYNSYSPKLDGTGATGTWDINISGVASKVNVNQHTGNDVEYPIVWSNQINTQSNAANQLYKSYGKLSYNPKNNRITATTFKGNLDGSASYLTSIGTVNPQTGRTQNYGHVYSYNTAGTAHEGAPTTYTSVIGFGRGTGGTVEIAGGWTSGMGLWYRALRDTTDDWYDWVRILDSKNYTSYLGYIGTTAVQASSAAQALTGITSITATEYYKKDSSNDYVLLGGGGHKKIDDLVAESNITTITKTLTVTQDWMDTGIKYQDLSIGTYIIQVFVNANNSTGQMYQCYFSGVVSWYNGGTNDSDSDEIILHRSGHAYGNTIYLRTIMSATSDGRHLRLQIAANKNLGAAYTYTFKFKKMI